MKILKNMMMSAVAFNLLFVGTVFSKDLRFDDFGARAGVSFSSSKENFEAYEIFAKWNLPWRWSLPSKVDIATNLETAAGILRGGSDNGLILAIGPGIQLTRTDCPVGLNLGINPAFLSEDTYGEEDIGGNFHIISHATLFLKLGDSFSLGYRIQHISNAGIESPNPGVNIQMLELSYKF